MRLFLDSSALAKKYIFEPGTQRVLRCCSEADEILLSVLAPVEVLSGLNRLRREKKISTSNYQKLKRDLSIDLEQTTIIDISGDVFSQTIECLEESPVRSLDAIQIGSAAVAACDLFLSADRRQVEAAKAMKLRTEFVS